MIDKILNVIAENKPEVEFEKDTQLFESGILDSFDLLIIVSELESLFEVSIPGELLIPEHFNTPGKILGLLDKLVKQ